MEEILIAGLSAGCLTVILCTSGIASGLRDIKYLRSVLRCPFCSSFWCSLLFDPGLTVLATMGVANTTVLLCHWSMSTYANEEIENETTA